MTLPRRKTLVYFALSLALIAVAVVWVGMDTSLAQRAGPGVTAPAAPASAAATAPATPSRGAAIWQGGLRIVGEAASYLFLVEAVLYFLFGLFFYAVGIAGFFLNIVYGANLIATPGNNPVVLAGWTALRDLANGLFILIVLWIAITIIFNLENLGGKRLLVRVIIVALLINFSLLMTTTIFAFSNQLALPFSRALGLDPFKKNENGTSLSELIMTNTNLHTVAQTIADEGAVETLTKSLKEQEASQPAQGARGSIGPASLWIASIPQSLGAQPPVPSAHAQSGETLAVTAGCLAASGIAVWTGYGSVAGIAGLGGGCAILGQAVSALKSMFTRGGSLLSNLVQRHINLAVADFFLAVTAFGIFSAAVLLAVRYVAMVFLGVFAPIAFLGLIVPRYGERIWNMWLDNLFRWAFVAPIFYFLLYLAIYMLEVTRTAQLKFDGVQNVPFQGNALYIFSLTIFLVFLWASIFLTRKAAGMGAEAALTFSKKLAGVGLGITTGFAARKALPWMGRAATGLQEKINQSPLARATFGRGLTAYGLGTATRASRKQLADRQTYINNQGWTSAEIQQRLASGYFKSDTDVAAAVGVLKSRGDLDKQAGVEGYGAEHLERAAGVYRGLKTDLVPLMRANPTVATKADFHPGQFDTAGSADNAINRVLAAAGRSGQTPTADDMQTAVELLAWERVRPQDIDTLDLDLLKGDGADKKRNRRRFLETATGPHLSRLANRDTGAAREVQAELDADLALWNSFSDKKKEYFYSSAAAAIGIWRTPPGTTSGSPFRALHRTFNATVNAGTAYTSASLVAGGSGAYNATYVSGDHLPPGLSIDNAGKITGTVDSTTPPSSFRGQYDISDGSGTSERITFNITIT